MDNIYEENVQKLGQMMAEDNLMDRLSEEDMSVIETIENILDSENLYIESPDSKSALILSASTNGRVFESVALSSYGVMKDLVEDDEDEDEDEDDAEDEDDTEAEGDAETASESLVSEQEEKDKEDDDEDEEEEEEDEEDEKESNESAFESEEDKQVCQEAIINLIYANEYIIRPDVKADGLVINENSSYFEMIQESLIERFVDTCESDEEFAVCEEIINDFTPSSLEEAGYGVDSSEKEEVDEGMGMDIIKHYSPTNLYLRHLKKKRIKARELKKSGQMESSEDEEDISEAGAAAGKVLGKTGKLVLKKAGGFRSAIRKLAGVKGKGKMLKGTLKGKGKTITKVKRFATGISKKAGLTGTEKKALGLAGKRVATGAAVGAGGLTALKLKKKLSQKKAAKEEAEYKPTAGDLIQELDWSKVAKGAAALGKKAGILKKGTKMVFTKKGAGITRKAGKKAYFLTKKAAEAARKSGEVKKVAQTGLTKKAKAAIGVGAALGARKLYRAHKAGKMQKKITVAKAKGKKTSGLQKKLDIYKAKRKMK
jgi:hypothetical protein